MSLLRALIGAIGGVRVQLNASYGVSDGTISPTNANARFKLEADGDIIQTLVSGGSTDLGDWITPKGAAGAAYECQSSVTSGTLSVDPSAGSWVSLGSDREWSKQQTSLGVVSAIFTLKIRRASDMVELASTQVTLTAEKTV